MGESIISLSINPQYASQSFYRIALDLFSRYHIKSSQTEYYLTELEFYFSDKQEDGSPSFHNDPFIHGHETQLKNAFWYFHWSGIDITIGDGKNKGGILIRGVKKKLTNNTWKYVSGPLNVSREFLSGKHNIYNEVGFKLQVELSETRNVIIYSGRRIGLNSEKDNQGKFLNRRYRYAIEIDDPAHKLLQKGTMRKINENEKL